MRKLKILTVSTLAIMALVALTISVAGACDGAKKADATTASTDAKVATSGCSAKAAQAADAKTAGASGCSVKAAGTKTAGVAGCSANAAALADGHCKSAAAAGPADLVMETVRMPSGALAVFYSGETDATIAALQAKAGMSPAEVGCDIAKCMSTNEFCKVEVAKTARGLMMLVTSDKPEVLDGYQERYTLAMTTETNADESGE